MKFISLALLCISSAWANTADRRSAIEIKSIHDGYVPYEIVYADEKGTDTREPGIYVVKEKRSDLILPGEVLGSGRAFNGIIAQLQATSVTGRHEAIAVVDGKLTLFSQKTKPSNRESLIVMGSKEHPLIDVLTGNPVVLAPIQSIKDVNFYTGYGIILISVRQPHALGDGFTFALRLESKKSDGATLSLSNEKIVLLDYQFLTKAQLERLQPIRHNSDLLISRTLILSLTQPREEEQELLKDWKKYVREELKARYAGKKIKRGKSDRFYAEDVEDLLPWYEFGTGGITIQEKPKDVVMRESSVAHTPVEIHQVIDPITNQNEIIVGPDTHDAHFPGLIDSDEQNKQHLIFGNPTDDNDKWAVLSFINGELYAFFESSQDLIVSVKLENAADTNGVLQKLAYQYIYQESDHTHYFIVSRQTKKNGTHTTAYVVKEVGKTAQLISSLEVMKGFIDKKELSLRIRTKETAEENNKNSQEDEASKSGPDEIDSDEILSDKDPDFVAFDNVTPIRGAKVYEKKETLTVPFLNITKTQKMDSPVQMYFKPLERQKIIENLLVFRRYDPRGAVSNRSGIYVLNAAPNNASFWGGEILTRKFDRSKKPVLDTVVTAHNPIEGVPELKLAVLAGNSHIGEKLKQFEAFFYITNTSENNTATFLTTVVEADFDQLVGAKILKGKKKHQHDISVLFFFKKATGISKLPHGGVLLQRFNIEKKYSEGKTVPTLKLAGPHMWVERSEVRLETLKHRIVPDREGNLYWITTPQFEKTSGNFGARKLATPENTIFPNRAGSQVSLRHDEAYSDDWGSFDDIMSQWLLYTTSDLEKKFPAVKQQADENKKNNVTSLFTEFEDFLETLASPSGQQPPAVGQAANTGQPKVVLLVEPKLKEFFQQAILSRLITNTKGRWSFLSKDFNFYAFDADSTLDEFQRELKLIQDQQVPNRKDLLYADAEQILKCKPGVSESKDEDDDDERKKSKADASPIVLLASDGLATDAQSFKKIKASDKAKTPMLILATPGEWRRLKNRDSKEEENGVFDQFTVNARFLSSSWTLWPPDSEKASKEIKNLAKTPVSDDERKVFPNLEEVLSEAADPTKPHQHRVLIVSEDLRDLVFKLIISRWASTESEKDPWSHRNRNLALYKLKRGKDDDAGPVFQEVVRDNFEAMRGKTEYKRVVLVGELDEALRIGRPIPKNEKDEDKEESVSTYRIQDPAVKKNKDGLIDGSEAVSEKIDDGSQYPHLMWFVGTEGRLIQPAAFMKEQDAPPAFSSILFGSQKAWEHLERETAFEKRLGLLNRFKVVKLEAPAEEVKTGLIQALFDRPEVVHLRYRFELDGRDASQARNELIATLVNRTEHIASSLGHEATSAFIRMYSQLRRALIEDVELRNSKKIDRPWIERLLSTVFPLPISFATLPEGDPRRILKSPDEAAVALQQIGYEGPFELKRRIFQTQLSQTRGSDGSRPIPNSVILFGGTSTGKTHLFEKTAELLKLKTYDPLNPQDEDVDAFILRVGNLVETEDKSNPQFMTAELAIAHLIHFLSLPKGYRGYILIDDPHKAKSSKILSVVMSFLRSLFDAKDGILRVNRLDSKTYREIPVRNINLYMTLNPRKDREVTDRFITDSDNLVDHVVAALVRQEDVNIEESDFIRWADIIPMDQFPRDAKVPTLVRRIREATQQEYSTSSRLTFISPEVLARIVKNFPLANARDFLATVTNTLLGLGQDLEKHPAYLLLPKADTTGDEPNDGDAYGNDYPKAEASDDTNNLRRREIEEFIRKNTVVKPITLKDQSSVLDLLSYSLEGFRIQIYETLLLAAQEDVKIAGTFELSRTVLSSFILGVLANISDNKKIPLSALSIKPQDIGATTDAEKSKLIDVVQEQSRGHETYFPFKFDTHSDDGWITATEFLSGRRATPPTPARIQVFSKTAAEIAALLQEPFTHFYRLENFNEHPDSLTWIHRLKKTDPTEVFKQLGKRLLTIYEKFKQNLYDTDLVEMSGKHKIPEMSDYDKVRLFLLCVDKAMTDLPWAVRTRFLAEVLTRTSSDLSLGQKPEVQHYVFAAAHSPLRVITPDYIFQTSKSSRAFQEMPEEQKRSLRDRYQKNCSRYLVTPIEAPHE